jgi:TetR/AcrR family transcriptional regulator
MVANRGYESLGAKSRLRLIDAATELLSSEGHPAFTARRIADHAELKPQLVHYYFRSMEDLVVAVFQRTTAEYFQRHDQALSSPRPIRAIWELNSHLPVARLMTEFVALAKRYPKLRDVMTEAGSNFRELQIEAIDRRYGETQSIEGLPSAKALAVLLSALARSRVIEGSVGMTVAHADAEAFVLDMLDRIDPA